MSNKLDLVKEFKEYYSAAIDPELAKFETIPYLSVIGQGEPGGKVFSQMIENLFPVAYGVKKLCKSADKDFGVPKREGLCWVDKGLDPRKTPKSQWHWKLLIRMPSYVDSKMVSEAKEAVKKQKGISSELVEFEKYRDGKCVQMMHIGPYSTEEASIDAIHDFISTEGFEVSGYHHEIYISDPRKVVPSKMKTIIRQSVK